MVQEVSVVVGLVAFIAVVAFSVLEVIKGFIPFELPAQVKQLAVAVMTVYACVVTSTDMLTAFGLVLPSAIGPAITGLIASKGSNGVHDFIKKVMAAKNNTEEE